MKKILKILGIILVLGIIATLFDSESSTNKESETLTKKQSVSKTEKESPSHPPQSVLDAIQKSLDINGEDRWANWKVGYNNDERKIYIQVAADPMANKIAMSGYIKLIKDIHQEHASEYNMVGRVFQLGEQKESCIVKGQ